MKYNIFFSLNSSYFPYGKMFIRSLYEVLDLSKVDKVIIADTGLTEEQKDFFLSFDRVELLETNLKADFDDGGTWGKGWQSVVTSKAKNLHRALIKYNTTTVMVDADCIFTQDVAGIISDQDIQLCYRGDEKPDNPYLGSYVVFKPTEKSYKFLDIWTSLIDSNSSSRAKESPMLAKAVNEVGKDLIENIPRKLVSCYTKGEYDKSTVKPFIVHFKGGSLSSNVEADIKKRIYGTHGFDELVEKYLKDV